MKTLYVAYTGLILLNILNIRANKEEKEEADLFINKSTRISPDLISFAKQSGLFRKVIVVESFSSSLDTKYSSCPLMLKVILSVLSQSKRANYYESIINSEFQNPVYDSVITHGLWLDSLFIVRSAYLKNNNLKVYIVEEGTGTLYSSFNALTNHLVITRASLIKRMGWKAMWFLSTRHRYMYDIKRYQRIINGVYSYTPKLSRVCAEKGLTGYKLLPFTPENTLTSLLTHLGNLVDISELSQRKYIVFTYDEGLENSQSHHFFISEILSCLLEIDELSNICFKSHPLFTLNELYYSEYYPGLSIDNRKYQLETIYPRLDLDNKILITRVSSAVYTPKYMFDKEPYVILTDFLYPSEVRLGKNKADLVKLVSDLKSEYRNPEKVILPNDIEEFKHILIDFYRV